MLGTPHDSSQNTQDPTDLHGMVPDKCSVALLLIDVINDLEFEGAEKLLRYVPALTDTLALFTRRARQAGIPVVYVNDNYGKWQSDFTRLIEHCLNDGVRGQALVEALTPGEEDYFVLKPKHSGFYSTTLEVLLEHLGATTLILTGIAGNICVLFTANDAYMRGMRLYVPADGCISNEAEDNAWALAQMEKVLKADTRPAPELDLERFVSSKSSEAEQRTTEDS